MSKVMTPIIPVASYGFMFTQSIDWKLNFKPNSIQFTVTKPVGRVLNVGNYKKFHFWKPYLRISKISIE